MVSSPAEAVPPQQGALDASTARKALTGFFLSGILFSFLGAILPAWGYHIHSDYSVIGYYFLAMNLGIAAAFKISQYPLRRWGLAPVIAMASVVACAALLYLAIVSTPVSAWWRMIGVFWIGVSGATINIAVFHAISPTYEHDPGATLNLAGALFGTGCLLTALLVAGTFYVYSVAGILVLLAAVPGFFAGVFAKARLGGVPPHEQPSVREAFKDFRSPGAVLFALLLFFQFGNEWSVAGWLPLFLIQRLGASPASSLLLLAFYWLALLVGRVAAQAIVPRAGNARVLFWSVSAALLGCLFLFATNNLSGAFVGILLIGSGFAPIYPLVVEKIEHRFPYYHPGFFNGIFSFALTGGLIAPWSLGYFAELGGIGMVMLIPSVGSLLVFLLTLLIWLESRLSRA